ncbi:hypothetical protein CLV88_101115 [Shimia abyssi]|uniref:Calcineurin-like phosphoesterase family protein n=1 Tax=Shimia abyssi TaxID=1662395 RepID=A0A2P8FJ01_9RHOB|nr:hypothetical protein CLV88_101115 [Shimia abyssi]
MGDPYVGLRRVEQVVKRTNALGADLIVLLGDYVAGHCFITHPVEFKDVAQIPPQLTAPQGAFSILRNNDWWDDLFV